MTALHWLATSGIILSVSLTAFSADEKPRGPGGGKDGQRAGGDVPIEDLASLFRTDVLPHLLDVVLGRPTKNSITASVLAYSDREGVIQYGPKAGVNAAKTAEFALKAGVPAEVALTGLQPDTQYLYRLSTREGSGGWSTEPERSFRTQRAPGSTFTFTVQADPHLDSKVEPKLLERSLLNCLADAPDFLIDLGDTFMTDKYRGVRTLQTKHYFAQRYTSVSSGTARRSSSSSAITTAKRARRADRTSPRGRTQCERSFFRIPFPTASTPATT